MDTFYTPKNTYYMFILAQIYRTLKKSNIFICFFELKRDLKMKPNLNYIKGSVRSAQ